MRDWRTYFVTEADDDEGGAGEDTSTTTSDTEAEGNNNEPADDTPDDEGEEPDPNADDDAFNVDSSDIDNENPEDSDNGDNSGSENDSGDSYSSGNDSNGSGEEEPIEANTDLFASLSANEQAAKILELKRNFAELYTSVDDMLKKVNDLDTDNNMETIFKVTNSIYDLKKYIEDYIINVFPTRSYVENKVNYTKIILILKGISSIIADVCKNTVETYEMD